MPRTRTCDYCGGDIEPGTGTMFVRTNGATIHYCSSKCENNHDLGREARNLEWTEAGRPEEPEADEEAGEEHTDEDSGVGPAVEEGTTDEEEGTADEESSEAESDAADGEEETEAEV